MQIRRRIVAHSKRIAASCPFCGTMVTVRPTLRRPALWRGRCKECRLDLLVFEDDIREKVGDAIADYTGNAGLYRVRQKLGRLWAISFPCKGRA